MQRDRLYPQTQYEWDLESVDEYGDIIDHNWFDNCPGTPTESNVELVLIKDIAYGYPGDPDSYDMEERTWAYVVNGFLPDYFQDGSKVPARFHTELFNKEGQS